MSSTNRRQFLQASAAAGLGFYVGTASAEDKKERSPIERLRFACIGVGGKGFSDTDHAGMFGDVVALCDIDDNTLNSKGEKFSKAKKFHDFRELFDKMGKEIDAVVISTPDHTHAPAAAMAIRMGKHVYGQKPLTHSVHEARKLRELAREFKVCTQMGNQGTALDEFRTSVELLQSHAIGPVREVHVWTNRPIWPQAPKVTKRPAPAKAPEHVKWDLFLGPAAERPYAPGYHPFAWRGWWDFGTGALGDMACHTANMPFMGLKLTWPTSISAESETINEETYPGWAKVTYEFPARAGFAPVRLIWYEGKKDGKRVLPSVDLLQGKANDFSGSGCLIIGEKATIYSPDDYGATRQLIGKNAEDIKKPERKLPRRGGNNDVEMKKEWVEAIKKGNYKHALGNFDYAATLTESILLGNAAIKAGSKLSYDGKSGKFAEPGAEKLLQREYRTGWKL
ncbi:MAG: Gfo/Idh/MocA family oxidoreductase [Gemmataceae bacterium]